MKTNDEIIAVFIRNYDGENWIHKESLINPSLESWMDTMLNEARDDTANEIFAKLDKVVWQQLEASRLKEFLIQFSNAKDEEAALKVATAFSIIGLDAEKYEALKKQYKVD